MRPDACKYLSSFPRKRKSMLTLVLMQKVDSRLRGNDGSL